MDTRITPGLACTSEDILAAFWDGTLPVQPCAIAQNMGATVVPASQTDSISSSLSIEHGSPVLTVNRNDSQVRQRFAIAHGIGHLARRHVKEGRETLLDTPSNFSLYQRDPLEADANRFAVKLLMPADAIEWAVKIRRIGSIGELAEFFIVSGAAMELRLKSLNYLRG